MFRVPLGILATLIPNIALLAASHRSEQTKEQIRITSEQNVFSNYYKHLEEFLKHCKNWDVKDSRAPLIQSPRRLYGRIYPNSINGDYSIDERLNLHIENYANDLHSNILNTARTYDSWCEALPALINGAVYFFDQLGLSQSILWDIHSDLAKRSTSRNITPTRDLQETIRDIVNLSKELHYALEFDVNYKSSPAMQKIVNMDIEDVPRILLNFSLY